MTAFPDDIWHLVSKYLKPKELYNLLRTNRYAKDAIGPSAISYMKLWGPSLREFDKIFKDYDWVESVESRGLTPVLIFRDERKLYVDLYLAIKEVAWQQGSTGRFKKIRFDNNGPDPWTSPEEYDRNRLAVFDAIFQSLRCQDTGQTAHEVKFSTFTLCLRGVLACPGPIPSWNLQWAMQKRANLITPTREIEIVMFGKGTYKIKAIYRRGTLELQVAGFEPITYEEMGHRVKTTRQQEIQRRFSRLCSLPTGPERNGGKQFDYDYF